MFFCPDDFSLVVAISDCSHNACTVIGQQIFSGGLSLMVVVITDQCGQNADMKRNYPHYTVCMWLLVKIEKLPLLIPRLWGM